MLPLAATGPANAPPLGLHVSWGHGRLAQRESASFTEEVTVRRGARAASELTPRVRAAKLRLTRSS